MKLMIRRIITPLLLLAALWTVVTMLVDLGTQEMLGVFEAERMAPYANAHLLEEAEEGIYSPLLDPIFISYIVAVGVLAFGVSAAFAAWGASKQQLLLAALPPLIVVVAIGYTLSFVWSSEYPSTMRIALAVELFFYICCSLAGLIGTAHFQKTKGGLNHG